MCRGVGIAVLVSLIAATSGAADEVVRPVDLATRAPSTDVGAVRCDAGMFRPNYVAEIGALQGEGWREFPLRVWIDAGTVKDEEELRGLKAGLRSWADATGGVLGVKFVAERMEGQVEVRMVDRLPGGRAGQIRLGTTDLEMEDGVPVHGHLRIVHATPAVMKAVGVDPAGFMARGDLVQRTAGHEMGHVLMGSADRHPKEGGSILRQGNLGVLRPGKMDVNTAKVKYCGLFGVKVKESESR
jgi:hypothetical protein